MSSQGEKIGWLDSTRQPSHVHRTLDGGQTTVCGYEPRAPLGTSTRGPWNVQWEIKRVPTRIRGERRFCRNCFKGVKRKSEVPWVETGA